MVFLSSTYPPSPDPRASLNGSYPFPSQTGSKIWAGSGVQHKVCVGKQTGQKQVRVQGGFVFDKESAILIADMQGISMEEVAWSFV